MKRRRTTKPKAKPSPPPECWIVCHDCKEVISNRAALLSYIEAMGATVRTYVCANRKECAERTPPP